MDCTGKLKKVQLPIRESNPRPPFTYHSAPSKYVTMFLEETDKLETPTALYGNRTLDPPACSILPQPSTLQYGPCSKVFHCISWIPVVPYLILKKRTVCVCISNKVCSIACYMARMGEGGGAVTLHIGSSLAALLSWLCNYICIDSRIQWRLVRSPPDSHGCGPVPRPDQVMSDLWCTKWHWGSCNFLCASRYRFPMYAI
jgi:hypothetical protein